jgi:hypothetical protein
MNQRIEKQSVNSGGIAATAAAVLIAAAMISPSVPREAVGGVAAEAQQPAPDLATATFFGTGGGGVLVTTDPSGEFVFANGCQMNAKP